jgi:hypothetical protein
MAPRARRGGEIEGVKGRGAEALVEATVREYEGLIRQILPLLPLGVGPAS